MPREDHQPRDRADNGNRNLGCAVRVLFLGKVDYAGALLLVERLLELQPDDEEARKQADKLQSRIDFQTRT